MKPSNGWGGSVGGGTSVGSILRRPRPLTLFTYFLVAVCLYLVLFHPRHHGLQLLPQDEQIQEQVGGGKSQKQVGAGTSAAGGKTAGTRPGEKVYGRGYSGHSAPADVNRVTNATLGFGKILVLNLPERSDKRDALSLAAGLTGFEVEYIEGVRGASVPDKALPVGGANVRKTRGDGYVGSWRSHMNAVRKIVEENLSSALILEDDMDWDVRLKPQLELIAQGSRSLLTAKGLWPDMPSPPSSPAAKPPYDSPYGPTWDLLWLGHCGEVFPEQLAENAALPASHPARQRMDGRGKFSIFNDATVPPLDKTTGLVNFTAYPPHTRWVHVTGAPICSFAYALSQRGARKLLYQLAVAGWSEAFDNALAGVCRRAVGAWKDRVPGGEVAEGQEGADEKKKKKEAAAVEAGLDMRCLTVTPPIFFHHKAKGSVAADSDINVVEKDDKLAEAEGSGDVRKVGSTENIVWSARLNLVNMMLGREMESQF